MKTKQSEQPLTRRMAPYVKGYGFAFIIAIILSALSSIVTIYGPNQIKEITNTITKGLQGSIDLDKVASIAGLLAILYVCGAIANYVSGFIITTIIQRFAQRLRKAIAVKINRVPLNYFDSHEQGDVLSRVTNDVDLMTQSLNQSLGAIISSIILLIGSIVMMFVTDWHLALTAILSALIGFVVSGFIMKQSQPLFKKQQANLARVSGYVEEIYTGHNLVVSYNARKQAKGEFDSINSDLKSSMWKSQFFSGIMMPMMQFIGNFGYVMVCVVGAALAIEDVISIGTIVAFMMYVRIFTQPITQMAQGITQMQSASAAMSRVFEFLGESEMEDEAGKTKQLETITGQVNFNHVSFGYLPGKTIVHDFTAEAKPGQKVAIVGPTGAGKTTMVNLLMRFYEIDGGEITIDGVNTKSMTREEVHDAFSMVLQDTWLFEGTVRENLVFNQHHITDDEIVAATKAVGVHHFITTLPGGYDTVLDDSVMISVGQKQLLTIARALLKDAPLLILDEATSSVDTRTEELLQKAMDKLMENRTSFVIAHRLSTIKNADLILVMKDGNIIEQGNHDVLMSQNGFYADLYNSQFSEEAA